VVEKVAIPVLDKVVAPCFEVAHQFAMAEIAGGRRISKTILKCKGCEGYGRVKFLVNHKVDILICNGIKLFYRDLLNISGLKVFANIADSVDNALDAYLSGNLIPQTDSSETADLSSEFPHGDLVCRARELFENNGYEVSSRPEHLAFLIDLVAEITCPLCRKTIKVGICCGAHTYRLANEIMEFHHIAPNEFHAKVYVYPFNPGIYQTCSEFGIELIDPDSEDDHLSKRRAGKIPILRNPISGHEKACMSFNDGHK
jgi:predicted Fe-Mo cluster-binding NifX family protein